VGYKATVGKIKKAVKVGDGAGIRRGQREQRPTTDHRGWRGEVTAIKEAKLRRLGKKKERGETGKGGPKF